MDKILESLSPHNLIPALESNMVEFWETYGRATGCELYHGEDMVRVLTGVPAALFNGAYRARLAPDAASAAIKECFRRMKANGIRTVEIASRAEPNISNFLYDSLHPQTKREVHKYARAV